MQFFFRYSILNILGFLLIGSLSAQQANDQPHTEWLTGIKDTSYTSYSDYHKNLKHYPI